MTRTPFVPVWKTAPFIRLLLPFVAGIILQWRLQFPLLFIISAVSCFAIANVMFSALPPALRFRWRTGPGLLFNFLLVATGMLLTWLKDGRHSPQWYGNLVDDRAALTLRITDPLQEKPRSYKTEAAVIGYWKEGTVHACEGRILVYFSKDSAAASIREGDLLVIHQPLQSIRNSGNPGAFDYQQYASFRQLYHSVYLEKNDWVRTGSGSTGFLHHFLASAREAVLQVLRSNIPAEKDLLGIAEALLIGYTQDLDKDLVQAYSNTGVVHIIAISGMHLALIYVLLVAIFARLPFLKRAKGLQLVLVLIGLWLFALLTGAGASVLRSAVMFSFVALGRHFGKQAGIYNALAVSAFVLLCYNPFYLWDVGFQLSYLAVLGIVLFQRPVYQCLLVKNKWLDKVWQLASVSLAAQVLTFPVCIYYFHQFPNLFLLVNMVAVPLSGLILYAEILLLAVAWIPFAGPLLGKLTGWLLGWMNTFIRWVNSWAIAVWDNISASLLSTCLLYGLVLGAAFWGLTKRKELLLVSLAMLVLFLAEYNWRLYHSLQQQKIIVYNVPRHPAIDLVQGTQYQFIGDSALREDALLRNFHLKPARIAMGLNSHSVLLVPAFKDGHFWQFGKMRIGLIDKTSRFETPDQKIEMDILIISGNPRIRIAELQRVFDCPLLVMDAANSLWKIAKWKSECEALNLRCYSVPEEGAFILDL